MFKNKETVLNFVYSFGAAVVIAGAFFKMTHTTLGGLVNPTAVLGAGLLVEAFIFLIYAFNPPKEDYPWENVYPELMDTKAQSKLRQSAVAQIQGVKELEISLSQKLDEMLAEAKLDSSLFKSLKTGIDRFSTSVEEINKTVDVSQASQRYNDHLNLAANHLESMNSLYELQLDNGKMQTEFSKKYVEDMQKSISQSEKFNEELSGLTSNLNNLNRVYGSMLSAMKS